MNSTIILVTSVIFFPERPFSYIPFRSVFSPGDRLRQTIETIKSIRKYFKKARIVLIEGGTEDINNRISRELKIDYLYAARNPIIKWGVKNKYKSLGEILLLFYGLMAIWKYPINFIFKISGRYMLNGSFDLNKWDKNKYNFKIYGNSYSTRFYGFPSHFKKNYLFALLLSIIPVLRGKSLEEALCSRIKPRDVNCIENLGVEGKIGVDGNFLKE